MKTKLTLFAIAATALLNISLYAENNAAQSGAEVKVLWDDPNRHEFVDVDEILEESDLQETKEADAGLQIKVGPELLQYIKAYVPSVMQFLASLFQEQIAQEQEGDQNEAEDTETKNTSEEMDTDNEWANIFESITGDQRS